MTKLDPEAEAAKVIAWALQKPMPEYADEIGADDNFEPWELFGLYGSYDSRFDAMAITCLKEIESRDFKTFDNLAFDMFKELLCNMHLCDYGTSPRVCFATYHFKPLLPQLIERWEVIQKLRWGT